MSKQQHINQLAGRNSYSGNFHTVNVNNAAFNTPDMRGAIIAGGIADGLGAVASISNTMFKIDREIADKADQNGLNQAQMFFRTQMANFTPHKDPEKAALYMREQLTEFQTFAGEIEGMSDRGREQLNVMSDFAQKSFATRQKFGRAKMIESEYQATLTTNMNGAIKSGDVELTKSWAQKLVDDDYMSETKVPEMLSKAVTNKHLTAVRGLGYLDLKATQELLSDVDKNGKYKEYKELDDRGRNMVAKEVSRLIHNKRVEVNNEFLKSMVDGKISNEIELTDYYQSHPGMSLATYNNQRNQFRNNTIRQTNRQIKAKKAYSQAKSEGLRAQMENKILLYEWDVTSDQRQQQFADTQDEIMSLPISLKNRNSLIKQLQTKHKAVSDPKQQNKSFEVDGNIVLAKSRWNSIKDTINVQDGHRFFSWVPWVGEKEKPIQTEMFRAVVENRLLSYAKAPGRTAAEINKYADELKTEFAGYELLKDFDNKYKYHSRPLDSRKPETKAENKTALPSDTGYRFVTFPGGRTFRYDPVTGKGTEVI